MNARLAFISIIVVAFQYFANYPSTSTQLHVLVQMMMQVLFKLGNIDASTTTLGVGERTIVGFGGRLPTVGANDAAVRADPPVLPCKAPVIIG